MGVLPSTQPVATLGSSFILSSFDTIPYITLRAEKNYKYPMHGMPDQPHEYDCLRSFITVLVYTLIQTNTMRDYCTAYGIPCIWWPGQHLVWTL